MSTSLGHTPISLLDRIRNSGADRDWERFIGIYEDLIRWWLQRAGVRDSDLDDLRQEILVGLVKAVPSFQHNGRAGAFRKWLKTFVVQRVLTYFRDSKRRARSVRPSAGATDLTACAVEDRMLSESWEREHDEHVLKQLMAMVEPDFTVSTWLAFRRQVLAGETAADVSRALGLSVNAVLLAKSRVLKRLRQEASGLVE